jgi:hypothetical protein
LQFLLIAGEDPMPASNPALEALARSQVFVQDLTLDQAPGAIAAQLGGPDSRTPVLWRDADSELLVYPSETKVRLAKGFIIVELTVASDQTQRASIVFPFRVGSSPNEAVVSAVSETAPRGNAIIAARWARVATPLLLFAILRAGNYLLDRANPARPMSVAGVFTAGTVISFLFTEPVDAEQVREYFKNVRANRITIDPDALTRSHLGPISSLRDTH